MKKPSRYLSADQQKKLSETLRVAATGGFRQDPNGTMCEAVSPGLSSTMGENPGGTL
jgi:hypothetical protein